MKEAVGYQHEEGVFWMDWEDFHEYFDEITICKLGEADAWYQLKLKGVYNNESRYGPQVELHVDKPTKVTLTHKRNKTHYFFSIRALRCILHFKRRICVSVVVLTLIIDTAYTL